MNKNFDHNDIIPLINHSSQQSYGNVAGARKAMLERGWAPLNYALLEHEQLKKSRVNKTSTVTSNNNGTTEVNTLALHHQHVRRKLISLRL